MEPIITITELTSGEWNIETNANIKSKTFYPEIQIKDENQSDLDQISQKITKYSLRNHKNVSNKQIVYKNPFVYDQLKKEKIKIESQKLKTEKTNKWTCLICNESSKNKKDLIEHYNAHKEQKITNPNFKNDLFQCAICCKEFMSSKRYEKHLETHNDTRHPCPDCPKSFKRPYDLATHSKIHSPDKKMCCNICDFKTIYKTVLRTHISRHESEFKYRCEVCNKGFFNSTYFEEHKNFHSGAKPFTCELCGKSFPYTRYLLAHKRSMHQEKSNVPIVNECHLCQKRFAHKKSLVLHVRSHSGENKVLCDICGKSLSSNDHLKLHRRIHTGFKPHACSVCGKAFAKKCNLTLHERVHSGVKPYVCHYCGKCFAQRSTLVIHMRIHTGARPYVCNLCNKGFVAKSILNLHLKSCNRNNIMGHYINS